MAVIGVTYWTRRDGADRALLGQAAFDLCKALKTADDVSSVRYYWNGPDTVVVQVFADSAETLVSPPSADAARAIFALADMANRERFEEWIDPQTGVQNYTMAFG